MPRKGEGMDHPIIISAAIDSFNDSKMKYNLTKDSNSGVRILEANKVGLICKLGTEYRMVTPSVFIGLVFLVKAHATQPKK
jgi:hypothetical protein